MRRELAAQPGSSFLASGALLFVAALSLNAAKPCRRSSAMSSKRTAVALSASESEAEVLSAISSFPTNDPDDKEEVRAALKKLPSCGSEGFEKLEGVWKVEWVSNSGRPSKRKAMLSFTTFNVLPPTTVEVTGQYNCVAGDDYLLIQSFTIPEADGVEAAVVLSGKWGEGTAMGDWGKGAARVRCGFKLETVCVVPSCEKEEASMDMLKSAGLDAFLEPRRVDASPDYVDLQHISDSMRWHLNESGIGSVLTRLPEGEPFPFKLA